MVAVWSTWWKGGRIISDTKSPLRQADALVNHAVLTARGRRTRASIVAAAAELMYRDGVTVTSIDDVLAASGTGKSQMYRYFTDRSELVVAVIDHQLHTILASQPLLSEITSMRDIEGWAKQLLAAHRQPGGPFACPLGSMAAELKNDPAYRPALQDAFQRWERPLACGLREMVRSGELGRRDHPHRIAASTIGALQGGMLLARITMDQTPLRDTVQMALADIRRRVERQRAASTAAPRAPRSASRRAAAANP